MRATSERTTVVSKWEHYKFYLYIPKERNHNNKPYLYFYQNNDNGRARIRIYKGLKRDASVSELKNAGKGLASEVVEKLKSGWNPLVKYDEKNELGPRSAIQLCLEHWLAYRREVCDYGGMKRKALLSSQYLQTYVTEWLKEKGWLQRPIISFNKYDVELFLRTCAHKRQWGKVTYNTYRCLLGTFFNYLVGLQVLQTNPVRFTKKLNLKHDRSRFKIFEEEELKQVAEALDNDLAFTDLSIAAKLVFLYNIRPSEIMRLQVKDIDFTKNRLTLPASKTKNQNEAVFALRDDLCFLLKELTNGFAGEWYVFGGRNKVAAYPGFDGYLEQRWRVFRKKHELPVHLRFYALKHSSNFYDLKDGVSFEEIRQRNRHSNLQVTTSYIRERLFKEIIESSNSRKFTSDDVAVPFNLKRK